jgi:hypothetical protein
MKHEFVHLLATGLALGAVVWMVVFYGLDAGQIPGHPVSDVADHVQGMRWFAGELMAGNFPLASQVTHGPHPTPLWFIDPIGGLLSLPFQGLGPGFAYKMAIAIQLWLAAMALRFMVRDLTGTSTGSFLGGTLLVTSPFLYGSISNGLSEYVGLAPVLLYIWCLIRLTERDRAERPAPAWAGVWGVVTLTWVAAQSMVLLLGVLSLSVCFVVGRGWLRRLLCLTPVLLFASLPIGAMWSVIEGTFSGPVNPNTAPGWMQAGLPSVDLLGFIFPLNPVWPNTANDHTVGISQLHWLGGFALVVALMGGRFAKKLRKPFALFAVLCAGPSLVVAGAEIEAWGHQIALPLRLLYWDAMPFAWMHHPYRLTAILVPAMALFAAVLAAKVPRTVRCGLFCLVLVDVGVLREVYGPMPSTEMNPPSGYAELPNGAVLDWPPEATTWNRRYVLWQATHEHPIASGVNDTLPNAVRRDPFLWNLFLSLDDPEARLWNRNTPPRTSPTPLLPLQSMAAQGYTTLVLHPSAMTAAERRKTFTQLHDKYGAPLVRSPDFIAWDVR